MVKVRYVLIVVLVVLAGAGGLYALSSEADPSSSAAAQKAQIRPAAGQAGQKAWFVRCGSEEEQAAAEEAGTPKRGRCEIFQRLTVQDTGQRLAELAIGFPGGEDSARGVFVLPLGILLPPGVVMTIDDSQPMRFDVRYCDQNGCVAHVSLNQQVLGMMRSGNQATLTIKSNQGKDVNIPMPLTGFSKALDEVS